MKPYEIIKELESDNSRKFKEAVIAREDKNNNTELDIDSSSEWDNIMVCYPFLIKKENKLIMFYNGNEFGKTGIGYAISE